MFHFRSMAPVTCALLAMAPAQGQEAKRDRQVLAMGTTLSLALAGTSEPQLRTASEAALAEVARVEAGISTWNPDSTFSRMNQSRGAWMSMDAEWLGLLRETCRHSRRSSGAFDPVLGALIKSWGIRQGGLTPSGRGLNEARRASGLRLLEMDPERGRARLLHPDAALEEGGFGKGYALDRALLAVQKAGAASGLFDFGGQLLAFGKPVPVSLAHPKDRSRPLLSLELKEGSLSTTGTSERGRHILNPKTGRPCPAWGSVAVFLPTGLEADCLSTALYVMGPREGLRWATLHHVSACFLFNDGQIRMSPAFRALAPQIL